MISKAGLSSWLIIFFVAWVASGCGSSDDAEPSAASPGAADAVPAPQAAGEPAGLPANLPDDVPHYADSEVVFSRVGADMMVTLRLWTEDDVDDVSGYYSDQLAAQGWSTDIREAPDGKLILADKPGRKLMLTVGDSEDGERTQVDLVLGEL